MQELSARNGWFVPAGELLDYWFLQKLRIGRS